MKRLLVLLFLLISADAFGYTRQDSLRGGNGRGRDWWDVVRYDLEIYIDTLARTISGRSIITFRVISQPKDSLQIDLQDSLEFDQYPQIWSLRNDNPDSLSKEINWENYVQDGNVWWVTVDKTQLVKGKTYQLRIPFRGKPRTARNPPWDGGIIWTKDSTNKPWIAVACQGLGASSWWPCKDYQGDEPDSGMNISIKNVGSWEACSNGQLTIKWQNIKRDQHTGQITGSAKGVTWTVRNPINTYDVTFYIGDYAHWHDTLHGEKGVLDLDFYPLKYNEQKARKQWTQAKEMLRCFEYWLGPYPFYEDGYKLVEAPYLGMEHQSAIAYGNGYKNGYNARGTMIDRSGTGVGFSFDFIIIHESGHEWFGNNITAQDIADNWLHEGFTTYTETLFAEWIKGKDSAFAYVMGQQKNIRNDRPVIGDYGVNNEGSSDMYDKGAQVVHMIRMMLNDDNRFRELLRGLNRDFYHRIVTSKEVEDYISEFMRRNLSAFFDQYLRTTQKPVLEWVLTDDILEYKWTNCVPGFFAPVLINDGKGNMVVDYPAHEFQDGKVYGRKSSQGEKFNWQVTPCGWYDVVER